MTNVSNILTLIPYSAIALTDEFSQFAITETCSCEKAKRLGNTCIKCIEKYAELENLENRKTAVLSSKGCFSHICKKKRVRNLNEQINITFQDTVSTYREYETAKNKYCQTEDARIQFHDRSEMSATDLFGGKKPFLELPRLDYNKINHPIVSYVDGDINGIEVSDLTAPIMVGTDYIGRIFFTIRYYDHINKKMDCITFYKPFNCISKPAEWRVAGDKTITSLFNNFITEFGTINQQDNKYQKLKQFIEIGTLKLPITKDNKTIIHEYNIQ